MPLGYNAFTQEIEDASALSTMGRNGVIQPVADVSGVGFITGAGAAGQVTFFTAAAVVAGDPGFTYDSATNALTVAGFMNIGTTTDAAAPGDVAAGLIGANRLFWDQSAPTFNLTSTVGGGSFLTWDGTALTSGAAESEWLHISSNSAASGLSKVMYDIIMTMNNTANGAYSGRGLIAYVRDANAFNNTSAISGNCGRIRIVSGATAGTINTANAFNADFISDVGTTKTITTFTLYNADSFGINGTTTFGTITGLNLPAYPTATTKISVQSADTAATLRHAGAVRIGGTTAPAANFLLHLSDTTAGFAQMVIESAGAGGFQTIEFRRAGAAKWDIDNNGSGSGDTLRFFGGIGATLSLTQTGSTVLNTAALAANATDGFLYIASCAGTPTGVPTAFTGRVAQIYDTTNNKFAIYNGAWMLIPTYTQATGGQNVTNNVANGGVDGTIANYTDLTIYANDAAAIRNNLYQLARALKQDHDQLRAMGILT